MNIKHQTQPTKNTCVSTCIAMILNKPALQIASEFHDDYFDQKIEVDEYLHSKKIKCRPLLSVGNAFFLERVYFLSVPSLNEDAMLHQILGYWDDDQKFKIADPNQGYDGRRYYVPDDHPLELKNNEVKLKSYVFDFEVWFPE